MSFLFFRHLVINKQLTNLNFNLKTVLDGMPSNQVIIIYQCVNQICLYYISCQYNHMLLRNFGVDQSV